MKTICWDVDDVLNNLEYEWFNEEWLVSNSGCKLNYEELTENPPHKLLNISLESYLQSLDKFRVSKGANLEPNKDIVEWFNNFGQHFRHIVLSAVPVACANISAGWVIKHFGKWVRSFNFVPTQREGISHPDYDTSKIEFIKRIGSIDIFIEDSMKNLEGVEKIGVEGILIKRPWNDSALDIKAVLEKLAGMIGDKK